MTALKRNTRLLQISIIVVVFSSIIFNLPLGSNHNQAYALMPETPVTVKPIKTIKLSGHSQGATITKQYFIYTEHRPGDGSNMTIHRCKWPSFKSCDKTITTNVGHANVLDARWGSNYFWVLDTYNHKEKGHHWCFNSIDMKKVDDSKCGDLPPEREDREKKGGTLDSTLTQGLTRYGSYLLKAYGEPERLLILKNNKEYAMLRPRNTSGELEGVFVDGDTGTIYYTSVIMKDNGKQLRIYQVTDYQMPTLTKHKNQEQTTVKNQQPRKTSSTKTASKTTNNQKTTKDSKTNNKKKDSNDSKTNNNQNKKNKKTDNKTSSDKQDSDTGPTTDNDTSNTKCVGTTIIQSQNGEYCDDGKGSGILHILNLVITILSIGVGILGVIGITICGIQYLTASGDAQKAQKARRRIVQITIGLAVYAASYFLLRWLLPYFT